MPSVCEVHSVKCLFVLVTDISAENCWFSVGDLNSLLLVDSPCL